MQTDSSSPQKTVPPPEPEAKGTLDLDTIMAVIKAAVGPAIQSAMAPYANKITALEEASMHTSEGNKDPHRSAKEPPAPKGVEASIWAPMNPTQHTNTEGNNFMPVTRNERGKKAKNKANANVPISMLAPQANPTPVSYASAAAVATTTKQPPPRAQETHQRPDDH